MTRKARARQRAVVPHRDGVGNLDEWRAALKNFEEVHGSATPRNYLRRCRMFVRHGHPKNSPFGFWEETP